MRHKFDWVEVVVIAGIVGGLAFAYEPLKMRRANALAAEGVNEIQQLAERYGPGKHSRFAEEWIIRDFFQDRRNGVFLDVGANDYKEENNTYFLETALGWSGIAIDAQREFAAGYIAHRPRTRFFALFVSDKDAEPMAFYVPSNRALSGSSDQNYAKEWGSTVKRDVPTVTLNTLLRREGIEHLDFVSMDIELSEPNALAGLDIERFAPTLLCVEAHHTVRQVILDYFHQHNYLVVGKYLRTDTQNLYFKPASSHASPSTASADRPSQGPSR